VFLGQVQDMPEFYGELDVFVFPSLTEGLGVAVLEAMAMGLPVVAAAVGGVPEIVTSRQDGILVPPADPTAITAAVVELIDNPGLGRDLARRGRQKVLTSFTLQSTADRIAATYARLVEQNGHAGGGHPSRVDGE
jgi:glycosyltransferase involved in cell wall biosynthesis